MKQNKFSAYTPGEVHIRTADNGEPTRTIEGYAIVFNRDSLPMGLTVEGRTIIERIAPEAVDLKLLDASDIKMTMYHNMGRLLARSKMGKGTLSYEIDDKGVLFRFDAPHTQWGDEALEQVRIGNIDGCSFMFATAYGDKSVVERAQEGNKEVYTVKRINAIFDFTLTPDPAYPDTECKARQAAFVDTRTVDNTAQLDEMEKEINKQII